MHLGSIKIKSFINIYSVFLETLVFKNIMSFALKLPKSVLTPGWLVVRNCYPMEVM